MPQPLIEEAPKKKLLGTLPPIDYDAAGVGLGTTKRIHKEYHQDPEDPGDMINEEQQEDIDAKLNNLFRELEKIRIIIKKAEENKTDPIDKLLQYAAYIDKLNEISFLFGKNKKYILDLDLNLKNIETEYDDLLNLIEFLKQLEIVEKNYKEIRSYYRKISNKDYKLLLELINNIIILFVEMFKIFDKLILQDKLIFIYNFIQIVCYVLQFALFIIKEIFKNLETTLKFIDFDFINNITNLYSLFMKLIFFDNINIIEILQILRIPNINFEEKLEYYENEISNDKKKVLNNIIKRFKVYKKFFIENFPGRYEFEEHTHYIFNVLENNKKKIDELIQKEKIEEKYQEIFTELEKINEDEDEDKIIYYNYLLIIISSIHMILIKYKYLLLKNNLLIIEKKILKELDNKNIDYTISIIQNKLYFDNIEIYKNIIRKIFDFSVNSNEIKQEKNKLYNDKVILKVKNILGYYKNIEDIIKFKDTSETFTIEDNNPFKKIIECLEKNITNNEENTDLLNYIIDIIISYLNYNNEKSQEFIILFINYLVDRYRSITKKTKGKKYILDRIYYIIKKIIDFYNLNSNIKSIITKRNDSRNIRYRDKKIIYIYIKLIYSIEIYINNINIILNYLKIIKFYKQNDNEALRKFRVKFNQFFDFYMKNSTNYRQIDIEIEKLELELDLILPETFKFKQDIGTITANNLTDLKDICEDLQNNILIDSINIFEPFYKDSDNELLKLLSELYYKRKVSDIDEIKKIFVDEIYKKLEEDQKYIKFLFENLKSKEFLNQTYYKESQHIIIIEEPPEQGIVQALTGGGEGEADDLISEAVAECKKIYEIVKSNTKTSDNIVKEYKIFFEFKNFIKSLLFNQCTFSYNYIYKLKDDDIINNHIEIIKIIDPSYDINGKINIINSNSDINSIVNKQLFIFNQIVNFYINYIINNQKLKEHLNEFIKKDKEEKEKKEKEHNDLLDYEKIRDVKLENNNEDNIKFNICIIISLYNNFYRELKFTSFDELIEKYKTDEKIYDEKIKKFKATELQLKEEILYTHLRNYDDIKKLIKYLIETNIIKEKEKEKIQKLLETKRKGGFIGQDYFLNENYIKDTKKYRDYKSYFDEFDKLDNKNKSTISTIKNAYIAEKQNLISTNKGLIPHQFAKDPELKNAAEFMNKMNDNFINQKVTSKADIDKLNDLHKTIEDIKENIEKSGNENDKKILEQLEKTYTDRKNDISEFYNNPENKHLVDETERIIIEFKGIANTFNTLLKYLLLFCIFIYVIVLIISFMNVINLIYLSVKFSINLFYNPVIINNDILSYKIKEITRANKDDFSKDKCNVFNEQLTALSVFNMSIYIFYILLAYLFIYILSYIYYDKIMIYTHKFIGNIKEIDPDADLMQLIVLIFGISIVHVLIYRFILKNAGLSQCKQINEYEAILDNKIKDYIKNSSPVEYTEEDNKFYELLIDTTKYDEINSFFEKKINDLSEKGSDIGKYMLIYDLYNFFSNYITINDVYQYKIGVYLRLIKKLDSDKDDDITFIGLLDHSNKRLIKLSHEDLSFYKNIPKNKIELFKPINNEVVNIISEINKKIISYTGSFTPFVIIAIYIIIIFIYNVICIYILFEAVHATKPKNLFPDMIYRITDYYKYFINKLLDR